MTNPFEVGQTAYVSARPQFEDTENNEGLDWRVCELTVVRVSCDHVYVEDAYRVRTRYDKYTGCEAPYTARMARIYSTVEEARQRSAAEVVACESS